jgi:hypothetical protein
MELNDVLSAGKFNLIKLCKSVASDVVDQPMSNDRFCLKFFLLKLFLFLL